MSHTLLIALVVVGGITAIIFLCIYIAKRQSKQKKQRLLESHSAQLAQHNINPDFSQIFEHRIFAFDSTRRIFAFVQNDEALPSAVIELNDVSDCRLWKTGVQLSFKRNRNAEEHITTVGLLFSYKDGTTLQVPFYTEVLDGIEEKVALNKVAEHWLSKIATALPTRNSGPQALPV